MQEPIRCKVTNHRAQPVELHWEGGGTVVPPRGSLELAAEAVDAPRVQTLVARRYLSGEPLDVPSPEPAAPKRAPARRTARKSAGKGAGKAKKKDS